jgi:hypothetical protein
MISTTTMDTCVIMISIVAIGGTYAVVLFSMRLHLLIKLWVGNHLATLSKLESEGYTSAVKHLHSGSVLSELNIKTE